MTTHTEYQNIGSVFGLGRAILWLLTNILVWLSSMIETLYNHIFSLFNVVYSNTVVKFIQNWIGFLWIPIAISIVVLGYNLIMGEEQEASARGKAFAKNICLLMLVVFGLPYLFIGHAGGNASSVFTNQNQGGYTSSGNITNGNPGLIDFFTNQRGQGIIDGVSSMAGQGETSHTYQCVVKNTYDLKSIFQQVSSKSSMTFNKNWSGYLNGNSGNAIYPNGFYSNGTIKNGSAIMGIDSTETIKYDDVNEDDEFSPDLKAKNIVAAGYDIVQLKDDDNSKKYYDSNIAGNKPSADLADDIPARQFLFKTLHKTYQVDLSTTNKPDGDGTTDYILVNNEGKTKTDMPVIDIGSSYPFRYYFEWGLIFINLITTIVVLFLTSFKITKLIYNITVNQLFALFFAAADLSNGQRAKEILKSIFSLVISLFFAVILVEFYFVISDEVGRMTFVSNVSTNNWIKAIVAMFIGMAAIKGPDVLERVLGIDGGLMGEWREVGEMTRPVRRAAAVAGHAAWKTAKFGAAAAAGGAWYGYNKHKGNKAEKEKNKENSNSQSEVGKKDKANSTNKGSNNPSEFKPIRNKKEAEKEGATANTIDVPPRNKDASGKVAPNEAVAGQGRDIAKEVAKAEAKNGEEGKTEVANKYKGNIQNSAIAAQRKAEAENESLNNAVKEKAEATQKLMNKTNENISNQLKNANDNSERADVADRNREKIQNMAVAEQRRAEMSGGSAPKDSEALSNAYEKAGFTKDEAQKLADNDIQNGSYAKRKSDFDNNPYSGIASPMKASTLDDKTALVDAYKGSGFTQREAESLAMRDLTDGSYNDRKNSFDNSISAMAKERLQDSPMSYSTQMDAYRDAAREHYQEMGFSTNEAQELANRTADRVCLEDNQTRIREEAKQLQKDFPSTYSDDATAVKAAISNVAGGTIGYDTGSGDLDYAASAILNNGSLSEGNVRGRVAETSYRESIKQNTRANGLDGGSFNPALRAASSIALGYMKTRAIETVAQAGYEAGSRKSQKKAQKEEQRNKKRKSK